MSLVLSMPWPPKELLPNKKTHWAVKARFAKKYKSWCNTALLAQKVKPIAVKAVWLDIQFVPPDRRIRDRDNALASCKAMLDAISSAIGIDDSKFQFGPLLMGGCKPGGEVIVTITEIA